MWSLKTFAFGFDRTEIVGFAEIKEGDLLINILYLCFIYPPKRILREEFVEWDCVILVSKEK